MDDISATSKIDRANLWVMAVLGLASAILLPWNVTVGVLVGCAIMAFDFYILRKLLGALLSGKTKSVMISAVLLGFKFVGFFGLVALCLFFIPMNLLAFGVGATAVVITASIVAGVTQTRTNEK